MSLGDCCTSSVQSIKMWYKDEYHTIWLGSAMMLERYLVSDVFLKLVPWESIYIRGHGVGIFLEDLSCFGVPWSVVFA